MTPQQINEAVARKLGWLKDGDIGWIQPEVHKEGFLTGHSDLPDYCHKIEAAWEIVEIVRHKRKSTKRLFIWHGITIQTRANSRKVRVLIFGRFGMADTAPMAICLAFLKLP